MNGWREPSELQIADCGLRITDSQGGRLARLAGIESDALKLITLIKIRAPMRYVDGIDLQHVHGAELEDQTAPEAKLIFLQHTPVFTLGRKTEENHLLCSEHDLAARTGADVVKSDRGGSVTFHAPGQLTAYLLLNLQTWKLGIHQHLDLLEATAIHALKEFGLDGFRVPKMTGVWLNTGADGAAEKVCAIGVSAKRWVTYHGLSLNVDIDITPFKHVVPCGLAGKGVTTMARALDRIVEMSEVETKLAAAFGAVYGAKVESGMP